MTAYKPILTPHSLPEAERRHQPSARKLAWHAPPVHGRGRNLADVERSALACHWLTRRSLPQAQLDRKAAASEQKRNAAQLTID